MEGRKPELNCKNLYFTWMNCVETKNVQKKCSTFLKNWQKCHKENNLIRAQNCKIPIYPKSINGTFDGLSSK
jgi:hypothetical protein